MDRELALQNNELLKKLINKVDVIEAKQAAESFKSIQGLSSQSIANLNEYEKNQSENTHERIFLQSESHTKRSMENASVMSNDSSKFNQKLLDISLHGSMIENFL